MSDLDDAVRYVRQHESKPVGGLADRARLELDDMRVRMSELETALAASQEREAALLKKDEQTPFMRNVEFYVTTSMEIALMAAIVVILYW